MHTIKAIIFDFDGLILDTEFPMFQAWQEIFQSHGISLAMRDWVKFVGTSIDPEEPYLALGEHLQRPIDRQELRSKRVKREAELLLSQEALPGVEDLILEAKSHGVSLAVASNSDRNWVTKHLAHLNLIHNFDVLKCAEDVTHTKPHPDLYNATLETLGINPDEAIALEDSINGVKAAKAAGVFCVAIPNRITSLVQIPNADAVLNSLEGITVERLVTLATQKQ